MKLPTFYKLALFVNCMARDAVVAVITYNNQVLLGKKKNNSPKYLAGVWHVPGETIEEGESDERALIRGMREEADIAIRVGRCLGSHKEQDGCKEARWYECFAADEKVTAGSDLEALVWVPRQEVLTRCSSKATALWPKEVLAYLERKS